MSTHSPTVGIIYPGHAAEDDYPAFESTLQRHDGPAGVSLPVVISTIGVDEHTTEALLETGSPGRLSEAAARLTAAHRLDSLMWACTSGSFVYGWDGAHDQAARLTSEFDLPASSTSLAFARAVGSLGIRKVAVAASYPAELAEHFKAFLTAAGTEVLQFTSHDIFTAGEVGHMGRQEVLDMIRALPTDEADAVLVPDTAMHSLQWIDDLEGAAGKPVLTANQVTVWEGMRIAGHPAPQLPGLGRLFGANRPGRVH